MRKKYLSQIRYETNNPTITFRVNLKEKEKIENMAHQTGKSISELVRNALLDLEKDFNRTYLSYYNHGKEEGKKIGIQEGDKTGYTRGMNDWAIGIPCYKCNYKHFLYIKPNSDDHRQTIAEMRGRLSHQTCPK